MKRFYWLLSLLPVYAGAQTVGEDNEDEAPIDLEQVVITATRTPKKLKDTPVITQVITSKQLQERGVASLQDFLQQEVPGLNFQEVGYGTDIDIQGLGSKHVLFLVDGERIAGENGGNIDYQRINMSNVERIEIVKGASSALYGSQAMGGVINIITKEAQKKFEARAGVRYAGSYQKNEASLNDQYLNKYTEAAKNLDLPNLDLNATVGFNLGKVKSTTDFLRKTTDGYQLYDKKGYTRVWSTGYREEVEKSESPTSISAIENTTVREKLKFTPTKRLTLRADGSFTAFNRYDFAMDGIYEQNQDWTAGGGADYKFNEYSTLTANIHYDDYARYDKYELKDGRVRQYENSMLQPRLSYINSQIKNMTLIGGWELFRESLYGDRFVSDGSFSDRSQWYTTLFAQDDWKLNQHWSFVGGLRADYHKEYEWNVTPKVSAMYKLKYFTFRGNYARGYRSPTLKELYMNWNHLGMFQIIGNENLKPESNNYLSFSGEFSNKHFNVNANMYGNWFRNKIEGVWYQLDPDEVEEGANDLEYRYTNVNRSYLMGVEAMAKIKVCKYVNLHGTYNYLYTSKTDGVRLTSTSPHSGTARIEFNTHVTNWETVVNFAGNIMGKKDYATSSSYTDPETGEEVDAYYNTHVDAYSLWDLSVSQYLWRRFQLTLGVNNIFDFGADQVSFNSSTRAGRNGFIKLNVEL